VIGWHGNEIKSDKKCALYDRKVEKAFRPMIDDFVAWLQSGDYGDEYGDEGAEEESKEEVSTKKIETDEQKQQRLLIEEQKRAQEKALEEAKLKPAQIEESKVDADGIEVTDATKIEVEDEFDINDI